MFIKNPNQKVSYSFRINPELLENLKAYAKATNRTLPETLNNLLENSITGVNVHNDYLRDWEGIIINIPLMYHETQEQYGADGIVTDNLITFHRGTSNYLDYEKEGLTYEVKQIPNNLDTWTDTEGYSCTEFGIAHKGTNFVIVPELILNPDLQITERAITNCLKFLYFQMDIHGQIEVNNISYKDCFRRLKEAGNEEVLYKFRGIDSTIYKFSLAFMNEFSKDPEAYTRYDNYRVTLYEELVRFAKKYNDGTIVSLEEGLTVEVENGKSPEELLKDKPKGLVFTSDTVLTELLEENQTLQERVQYLETNLNRIINQIDKVENDKPNLEEPSEDSQNDTE